MHRFYELILRQYTHGGTEFKQAAAATSEPPARTSDPNFPNTGKRSHIRWTNSTLIRFLALQLARGLVNHRHATESPREKIAAAPRTPTLRQWKTTTIESELRMFGSSPSFFLSDPRTFFFPSAINFHVSRGTSFADSFPAGLPSLLGKGVPFYFYCSLWTYYFQVQYEVGCGSLSFHLALRCLLGSSGFTSRNRVCFLRVLICLVHPYRLLWFFWG